MTARDLADLADELNDVELAQAGDAAAVTRLFVRYRPLIAATAGKAARSRGLQQADREDLEADLAVVLLETIKSFDASAGYGLAAALPKRFAGAVSAISLTVAIPRSTLSRYYAIMKEAEGVTSVAAKIAPDLGMTTETFWSVHATLRTGTPDDAVETPWTGAPVDIATESQSAAIDVALSVLTDKQREVVELAFGFIDGEGHSDDWIAQELGKSKSVVRKTREAALEKMRAVLPASREEVEAFPADEDRPTRHEYAPIDWAARQQAWRERNLA